MAPSERIHATRRSSVAGAAARPPRLMRLVLLAGTFITVLDFFIVNVAVPSIERDLQASSAVVQFIVTGFALAYGCGLIIGGRLGDMFGRRRMYLLGIAMFTAASVGCGVAPASAVLIVARIAQGLAAALLAPQVLAILNTSYSGEARARAFNAYGVTMGLAAVSGQVIGGLLTEADVLGWGWRTCFLINIPVGAAVLAVAARVVPESRAPHRPRLDIPGMLLVALALFAVVFPLIEGRQQGWPAWVWWSLASAALLGAGYGAYERRVRLRDGCPVVDLALFRERAFTVGLLVQVTFYAGIAGFFLVLALYLQLGHGMSPLGAGLVFFAHGAGYLATSTTAWRLAATLGRQVIAVGALLRILGLGMLLVAVTSGAAAGAVSWLLPALVVDGAGVGLGVAPLATTVLSRINAQHAGAASGVLTTGLQTGNALGVALIGVAFFGALAPAGGAEVAYQHAFTAALVYLLAVAGAVAALVQLLPRGGGQS
jgi:EmrB/QacA subfamily drug resistance transporter